MRADDGTDPIFQRRDDPAAIGVILGIRRENHAQIQVQADRIAADLDVAFFQDVEEADLNFGREVGEFVDTKNPSIGAE